MKAQCAVQCGAECRAIFSVTFISAAVRLLPFPYLLLRHLKIYAIKLAAGLSVCVCVRLLTELGECTHKFAARFEGQVEPRPARVP